MGLVDRFPRARIVCHLIRGEKDLALVFGGDFGHTRVQVDLHCGYFKYLDDKVWQAVPFFSSDLGYFSQGSR
jgi:hypothetical protein